MDPKISFFFYLAAIVCFVIAAMGPAWKHGMRTRSGGEPTLVLVPWDTSQREDTATTLDMYRKQYAKLPGVQVKLISLSVPLVDANDWRIYAGATAAILLAALVAAWLPGRRMFTMRAAELLRAR